MVQMSSKLREMHIDPTSNQCSINDLLSVSSGDLKRNLHMVIFSIARLVLMTVALLNLKHNLLLLYKSYAS